MNFDEILSSKNLYTVFQPIVSLETGEVFAYEALTRIDDSVYIEGIKSLFKICRDTGISWQLEKKCIKSALKTARAMGLNRRLFLNIDSSVLIQEDLLEEYLLSKLEKNGIEPSSIAIEISGKDIKGPEPKLCDAARRLKSKGFKISVEGITDPGAALSGICALNPDFIKTSIELAQSINKDKITRETVRRLSAFCRNSGIRLIAAGIETQENLAAAMDLEIPCTQGFFIGKPDRVFTKASKDAFVRIISTQNKKRSKSGNSAQNIARPGSRPISKITRKGMTIPQSMEVKDVLALFDASPEISILTVVGSAGNVLGIIPRITLLKVLGTQYGFSIYSKKPISRLMVTDYLAVESFEPVEAVASKAVSRTEEHLYDPIVVEHGGIYFGVVIFKDLLEIIVNVEVLERTQELNKTTRKLLEQEAMQMRDLKLAEIVQKSIYPQRAPKTSKWDCAYIFRPMASVSGDVYDFYYDDKGNLTGAALFDVSGHGVASGLVGILSKYLAKDTFRQNKQDDLSTLAKTFNKKLIREKANVENYLTGILLRIKDDRIEYINAGHTDLLCIDKKNNVHAAGSANVDFRGSFFGIEGLEDSYKTVNIPLEKNSYYIMFTDCLTESRNLAGDELGTELLQKILARAPQGISAKQLLEYLIDVFEAFTEAVPLRDDLTVIVLKYTGE